MNERLKMIREEKKLNQADFAKALGMGQSTLAMMEAGKREILDRHIKTVCSIFNVNENWFRYGIGEMFIENERTIINQLSDEYGLDVLDRKIIECYLNLGPVQRRAVKEYVRSLVDAVIGSEEDYSEYREDYLSENAMPFAARSGDDSNLKEAQSEYDNLNDGEEDV